MTIPPEFFTPDYLAFVFGVVVLMLGVFTPTAFVGIKMDWSAARSLLAIVIGAIFVAFSYPQLRFWKSNTVNVEQATLTKLKANTQAAKNALNSARGGPDFQNCFDRAGPGIAPLDNTMTMLTALGVK
jgi:hypothetical protein